MVDSNKFMDVNGLSYLYNKLLERLGLFEDETTQNIEKFKEETLASINEAVEGIGSILDGKAEAAIDAAAKVDDFMKECTDTFATKSEVNNMISNLSSFEVAVVSALPKKGVHGTIYLMPASDGSGDDIYNEYLWIPGTSKFEKIGTTRIDLTPYAKTADVADTYVKKVDYNVKMSELEKKDADNLAKAISDAASKYVTLSAYNAKIAALEKADSDNLSALQKVDADNLAALQKADANNLAAAKEDAAAKYLKKTENAVSSTKLYTPRAINGTSFDGTSDITTSKWGTARNIYIADSAGNNTSSAVSVDGSGNVTLKLPSTITATLGGNSNTATKLLNTRTINGTNFDGTGNITTSKWGTARNIYIADSNGINKGVATSVDGSGDITLKLPSSLSVGVTGNAETASKLATARSINGTSFDGSSNIITDKWGAARNFTITDSAGTYTSSAVSVDGSGNVSLQLPANIKATSFAGSLVGNANSATKLATARTIQTNLSSTSPASFDGSANVTPGITGTLPIANGGTGATTAKTAQYNILNGLASETSDVSDTTTFAFAYTNPTSSGGVLYKRTASNVWSYIKGKISSEFGISSGGGVSGNASTATKLATARTIALSGAVTGSVNFDGSANVTITTSVNHTHNYAGSSSAGGAATSANKLSTARSINGTSFDGSSDITTSKWGAARTITIYDGVHASAGPEHTVDGSGNIQLMLPNVLNGTTVSESNYITNNKSSDTVTYLATEYNSSSSSNTPISLAGFVNGSSSSQKKITNIGASTARSWLGISQGTTVPTTLAQGNIFFLYNE